MGSSYDNYEYELGSTESNMPIRSPRMRAFLEAMVALCKEHGARVSDVTEIEIMWEPGLELMVDNELPLNERVQLKNVFTISRDGVEMWTDSGVEGRLVGTSDANAEWRWRGYTKDGLKDTETTVLPERTSR